MFPLGTVLVPKAVVPLHVFEPRYQTMLADVMTGDRKFGVVLIERGSEVGGGDVRADARARAEMQASASTSIDAGVGTIASKQQQQVASSKQVASK